MKRKQRLGRHDFPCSKNGIETLAVQVAIDQTKGNKDLGEMILLNPSPHSHALPLRSWSIIAMS